MRTLQKIYNWSKGSPFLFTEETTLDKYVVKLYARAYRDLDGIYTYIAENLLEPDTALNMADELESAILVWNSYRNAERSDALGLMQTAIIASCS